MTILKVLDAALTSPQRNFQWEIGKEYHCSDFCEDETIACGPGFYGTEIDGLYYYYRPDRRVFIAEVSGKNVNYDRLKRRWEYMALGREIFPNEIKQLALDYEPICSYRLTEILFPINPLELPPQDITQADIDNLIKWSAAWDSVWYSVRDSVGSAVWSAVRDSVGYSVGYSVGSATAAYISSLFPNIKKWPGIDHEEGVNPFQSCIDLWRRGFVPSFNGTTWRLHQGKDAKIVYEWRKR